jgi:putative transcriptional regulator
MRAEDTIYLLLAYSKSVQTDLSQAQRELLLDLMGPDMTDKDTDFGRDLIEAMKEVKAHRRGKLALPSKIVPSMSAERVKTIRKAVAKSPREFSERFGIPARTIEGWEQGRRSPDPAASVLLRVIEIHPEAVEEAVHTA